MFCAFLHAFHTLLHRTKLLLRTFFFIISAIYVLSAHNLAKKEGCFFMNICRTALIITMEKVIIEAQSICLYGNHGKKSSIFLSALCLSRHLIFNRIIFLGSHSIWFKRIIIVILWAIAHTESINVLDVFCCCCCSLFALYVLTFRVSHSNRQQFSVFRLLPFSHSFFVIE